MRGGTSLVSRRSSAAWWRDSGLRSCRACSDLFITAGFPPAIKIDGKMTPVSSQPLTGTHTAEQLPPGRAVLAQDFVAVTAACLLVRRSIYEEVGGLDESLAVAFNDVDFCLRVFRAGYRNFWTPYAELIHHESVSRGYENTPEKQMRFQREIDILQSRWQSLLKADPAYNPNLTYDAEDFSLAWPPRHEAQPRLGSATIP